MELLKKLMLFGATCFLGFCMMGTISLVLGMLSTVNFMVAIALLGVAQLGVMLITQYAVGKVGLRLLKKIPFPKK